MKKIDLAYFSIRNNGWRSVLYQVNAREEIVHHVSDIKIYLSFKRSLA